MVTKPSSYSNTETWEKVECPYMYEWMSAGKVMVDGWLGSSEWMSTAVPK